MEETFVIVEVREAWYMLLLSKTLYCFACGNSATELLGVVKKLVKKYKSEEELFEAVGRFDDLGMVAPSEYERRQRLVEEVGWKYEEQVQAVVAEARKEMITESSSYKVSHKLKALKKNSPSAEIPREVEEEKPNAVGKKILPRRIVVALA